MTTRTFRNALLGLAALLLANTVLGPAGLDVVDYPLSASLLNQLLGLELVTVVLVVPALLLAARLAHRGRPEAALVAIGPAGYAAYMFAQYVVGPSSRDTSPAVLLHLVVFALGTAVAVAGWAFAMRTDWPVSSRRQRRRWTALLTALAAFVTLRYLRLLAGTVTGAAIPEEFASEPAFYWSIVLLDLGLVVPATVAAAVTVHRGSRVALPATYAVVGWFALVPPSVAAMAAVMLWREDPYASVPTTVLLVVVAVVTSVVAARMFAALLRQPVRQPRRGRPSGR